MNTTLHVFARVVVLVASASGFIASYGKDCAVKNRKHFGQVYTPTYLVQDILDVANYRSSENILEKHVIDNSCGDGAFLDEIVRRYCDCFLAEKCNKRLLSRHLSKYIHGIEIDVGAHASCIERLDSVAEEFGVKGVVWDIRNADTLTVTNYNGKMDFVVGNPPYVRVHNLAENFGRVKSFKFSSGGMTDLYLVFYEIGLRMLSENGILCYIAPSSWINSLAGKNMREYVYQNRCLRSIVDLGHYQPFDAMAYTAIVTLCRGNGNPQFDYSVYDGEHQVRYVCNLSYDETFFANALYLGDKDTLRSHRQIVQSEVSQYVRVKNGFATLADDVFISDNFPFSECVIPVLKASTGKWRKGFFPYGVDGKPIDKGDLFGNLTIASYLELNKGKLLKGRKENEKPDWYLYGRTQALKDVAMNKYAINTCIKDVRSIKFNRVPAGSGLYSGLYILTEVDEKTLKSVLMTDSFVNYIKVLKKYKSGGYYTFSSRDLEMYLNFTLQERLSKSKKRIRQSVMAF